MLLNERERNVSELCASLGTQSQPAVSHHLALLRHGRLIEPRRSGKHNFYGLTEAGRELAEVVLHPPLGPIVPALGWLPAATYAWTLWPAVGLLPPAVRSGYGLRWGPLERAVAGWLVSGWRAWRPILPAGFRQMPQALAADRRLEQA